MKTQNGFTLLENEKEFKQWLDKKHPTRKITKLQVHHMGLPDYSTWNNTDKKVYGDNRELGRTKSLDSYGKTTWNSPDGYGHYIAQHFNIFPNGKITTGRNLNSNPIGIAGWNTNAICVEIYGNFDKGKDIMTKEQRKAVIFVFALLAEKFNIPKTSTYIRPHAWFTSSGTYLGDYIVGKSRKTCPGTNFMGFGNSRKAFENNFYPMLKEYKYGVSIGEPAPPIQDTDIGEPAPPINPLGVYEVTADVLNVRKGASTSYDKVGTLNKGEQITISKIENNWGYIEERDGWISLAYTKFIKETIIDKQVYNRKAKVVGCTILNARDSRPDENGTLGKIKFTLNMNDVVKIGYSLNGWCSVYTDTDYGFVNKKYLEFV